MKKSGMPRTLRDIDDGTTSMEPLEDHFGLITRVICYLLYNRQQRSLTWDIFLTHLIDNTRYTEVYNIYISIYINR
jgi:hypothetical protein